MNVFSYVGTIFTVNALDNFGSLAPMAGDDGCAIQTAEQKAVKNTYVMTFGAPAVFSEDLVEKYNVIFPDSSSMRVEMKGDPFPSFGRGVQAGTSFGVDGGFPDVDVDDYTEGGEFSIAGMALAAHSVAGYVSHFPSLL